jgi:hypothetical protein
MVRGACLSGGERRKAPASQGPCLLPFSRVRESRVEGLAGLAACRWPWPSCRLATRYSLLESADSGSGRTQGPPFFGPRRGLHILNVPLGCATHEQHTIYQWTPFSHLAFPKLNTSRRAGRQRQPNCFSPCARVRLAPIVALASTSFANPAFLLLAVVVENDGAL